MRDRGPLRRAVPAPAMVMEATTQVVDVQNLFGVLGVSSTAPSSRASEDAARGSATRDRKAGWTGSAKTTNSGEARRTGGERSEEYRLKVRARSSHVSWSARARDDAPTTFPI